MCLCPKWLQCTVSHVSANAWPCALRAAAAVGWKHNPLCHPCCDPQVGSCSGPWSMAQLLMAESLTRWSPDSRSPAVCAAQPGYLWLQWGHWLLIHQRFWSHAFRVSWSSALGKLHPFLLPGVPSCLKPWSCRFFARTLLRLAHLHLSGWAYCHPFCFLACALSCSALGSFAGSSWLPCPMNSAREKLPLTAAPNSMNRAWLEPNFLDCSLRRAERIWGDVQTPLKWVLEPLSHTRSRGRNRELKWNSCIVRLFLLKQGFYS